MIELKNYSTYSKEYGFLKINEILDSDSVKTHGVACLVEDSTLYSSVSFIEECKKKDIKPIIGLTVHIGYEDKDLGTVTLFAKNEDGFKSLVAIANSVYTNSDDDKLVDISSVIENNKDTFILLGSHGSLIYDSILNKDEDFIDEVVRNVKNAFGNNFYLEVLSSEFENHEYYNDIIKKMSDYYEVEQVATNNNRFNKKGHHKLFLKKSKSTRKKQSKFNPSAHTSASDYIKTVKQNETIYFKNHVDARNNIQKIVNQIEEYSLLKEDHYIPTFERTLRDVLRERYPDFIRSKNQDKIEEYKERIIHELNVIEKLGFENYFLVFDDISRNCKDVKFALRGSAISSLVTHMIGLSEVDPIENGLLFERFLNLGRGLRQELPDVDLETNDDKKVIKYLISKYGEDRIVSLSATSTVSSKSQLELAFNTIKDDILEKPNDDNGNPRLLPEKEFAEMHDMLKRSWKSEDRTLNEELEQNYRLSKYIRSNPEASKLLKMAMLFEGQIMSCNRSAASYAITPYDYKKIFSGFKAKDTSGKLENDFNVVEIGKENIEKMGLVKIDILSNLYFSKILNTCNRIHVTFNNDNKYEDKEIFEMLNAGQTVTINQLKSQAQLCKDVGVENFNDIVNIVALLRPGVSKDDRNDFIKSKKNGYNGLKVLEPILKDTYGIVIFDEQIMRIAKEVGGLSPEDADKLRSAMKIKKVNLNVIAELKEVFLDGAKSKGVSDSEALQSYELLEKIAGKYTFSKAHSIAYARLIYQQCWLKVNYPAEYFEFFLDRDTSKNERIDYVKELKERGINLLQLDVNRSLSTYKTRKTKEGVKFVDYALSNLFIDNDEFSKLIVDTRKTSGPYTSLYDFIERLLPKYSGLSVFSSQWNQEPKIKMNFASKVESLIKMGAFDKLIPKGQHNVLEGREILRSSISNAIELVLKPYVSGDFEYVELSNKVKPEPFIIAEETFYGGFSFAANKLIEENKAKEEKKNKMANIIKSF